MRNRSADDLQVEARIFARDLVQIDELKPPVAQDKGRASVIAANVGRLKLRRCSANAQSLGGFTALIEALFGERAPAFLGRPTASGFPVLPFGRG